MYSRSTILDASGVSDVDELSCDEVDPLLQNVCLGCWLEFSVTVERERRERQDHDFARGE